MFEKYLHLELPFFCGGGCKKIGVVCEKKVLPLQKSKTKIAMTTPNKYDHGHSRHRPPAQHLRCSDCADVSRAAAHIFAMHSIRICGEIQGEKSTIFNP
jgi:hypothetical protein